MLTLESLSANYGRADVLHDITLTVTAGTVTALIGSNGAGKTTMLRSIMNAVPKVSGGIAFEGHSIVGLDTSDIVARGISLVPEGRQIFAALTVDENLKIGAFKLPDRAVQAQRREMVLEIFPKLKDRLHFSGAALSGGEQQMLAIGRALMADPRLLLLDEPSMGLAPVIVDQVFDVIARLKASGITILLVEQSAQRALQIADMAYVLENGNVVMADTGAALLNSEAVSKAYLGI